MERSVPCQMFADNDVSTTLNWLGFSDHLVKVFFFSCNLGSSFSVSTFGDVSMLFLIYQLGSFCQSFLFTIICSKEF